MDLSNYIRFVAALAFVLALIGVATWAARRFGIGGKVPPVRRGDRRLQIVEVAVVDPKHRAVLLKRDDVEHLVLIGPTASTLIESGIAAPSARAGAASDERH